MAVANKIVSENYPNNEKSITVADSLAFTVGAIIGNTGVVANAEGKKIIKAGTPLAGDILKRNTAFVKATTTQGGEGEPDTSDAVAIALHDIDVTAGDENGTILVFGFVDLEKIDATTRALITEDVITALSKITFINGSFDAE